MGFKKESVVHHCPPVFAGKLCIEVTPQSKIAYISEELCIGCGICVKVCGLQCAFSVYICSLSECGLLVSASYHFFTGSCRNAHLKLFKLSTYRKIWIKTQLTVMAPTPLNYTG